MRAREVRDHLRGQGWPEPVVGDSGNGAHLLYRADLPNDPESLKLVKGNQWEDVVLELRGVQRPPDLAGGVPQPPLKGRNVQRSPALRQRAPPS